MRLVHLANAQRSSPSAVPPVVCWQGVALAPDGKPYLSETDHAFYERMRKARSRIEQAVKMFAVCSGPRSDALPGVTFVELPAALFPLLHPDAPARYRVAYGGRGGAKSWAFVLALLMRALTKPIRILAFRELQASIQESVHQTLAQQITRLGLDDWFTVQQQSIFSVAGAEFVFKGIRSNVNAIRSLEGIDIAFGEEAAGISEESWQVLIPTVRKTGSELWIVFNPNVSSDPTYQRFIAEPPASAHVVKVSWRDNPWASAELLAEKDYTAKTDPDAYAHIWEGECRAASEAQVFAGKYVIEAFEPAADWDGPYFGADWGFSVDPTTLIKVYISGSRLYVEHEAYGAKLDIDKTPALFDTVPGSRLRTIRADSARPETISYMQRNGFLNCTAVEKWSGSVLDGIAFLRSFEVIVVHPRCRHTAAEMKAYSYKVDRLTGDVIPEPLDKDNHMVDAMRYALVPLYRRSTLGVFEFIARQREREAAGSVPQN